MGAPTLIPLVVVAVALMPGAPSATAGPSGTRLTSFMVPIHQALASAGPLTPAKVYFASVDTAPPPPPAPAPAAPVVQRGPAPVSAPAAAPAAVPAVDTSSAAAWAASSGVVCIRAQESGDSYSEDTGNGYYGAYQDLLSTWESHGGTGLPSDAPPAVQDQVNYEIYLTGGWGQWSTARGCGL
ncbi:MAG: transglycosylase family protein [Acidimicrobiales bacterium]